MTQNERRTIMVVEDYDDTRLLLKKGLEGLGYSVLEASNGQEAVDIAERERPDLILMDLDLPILDGIAATQRIRQQAELENVPIVAVFDPLLLVSTIVAFSTISVPRIVTLPPSTRNRPFCRVSFKLELTVIDE